MRLQVNDTIVTFPSSLSEFTLGQRIDFHQQYGAALEEQLKVILSSEEGADQEAEITQYQFDKMFAAFAFFTGCTIEAAKDTAHIETISRVYFTCLHEILEQQEEEATTLVRDFMWRGQHWSIPKPSLMQGDAVTFGEVIDVKQALKDKADQGASKWEQLQVICAIFLRRDGESFDESFLYENSARLELMRSLPMHIALQVASFFEQFNNYVADHFPVFWPSRVKTSGHHSKEHYKRWGWVNFLKAIAKTKVFDIAGSSLNSIACARLAPAFDVLVYASEDKELGEAEYLDSEAQKTK